MSTTRHAVKVSRKNQNGRKLRQDEQANLFRMLGEFFEKQLACFQLGAKTELLKDPT